MSRDGGLFRGLPSYVQDSDSDSVVPALHHLLVGPTNAIHSHLVVGYGNNIRHEAEDIFCLTISSTARPPDSAICGSTTQRQRSIEARCFDFKNYRTRWLCTTDLFLNEPNIGTLFDSLNFFAQESALNCRTLSRPTMLSASVRFVSRAQQITIHLIFIEQSIRLDSICSNRALLGTFRTFREHPRDRLTLIHLIILGVSQNKTRNSCIVKQSNIAMAAVLVGRVLSTLHGGDYYIHPRKTYSRHFDIPIPGESGL